MLNRIKIGLYISLLVAFTISCSQKTTSEEAAARAMLDTLQYGQIEYNLMVDYFKSDTIIQKTLKEQLANGDESAPKFEKLLQLDYDHRFESGFTDEDIDALMFGFFTMQNVTNKFDAIERQLDSTINAAEIQFRKDTAERE